MPTDSFRKWLGRCAAGCMVLALAHPAGAKESVIRQAEVPAPVIATIKQHYPTARMVEFEVEEEHGTRLYEVKLRDGGRELEAKLTAAGAIVEEEEVITEKDLPEAVRKSLAASSYARAPIKKIERVVHKDRSDQLTFEIKVIDHGKTVELLYDPAGKLLARE
jgi:hypothetical protein